MLALATPFWERIRASSKNTFRDSPFEYRGRFKSNNDRDDFHCFISIDFAMTTQ
jgi:hypothetical protein